LWARASSRTWARRGVAAFVAGCVVVNFAAMELLREKKIASSGAYARSAEKFLTDLGLPRLGRVFGVVGYPFVQPAGWIFAVVHHAPVTAFEGIVGNWFLDRDGQWFQVQSRTLGLDDDARAYTMAGLQLGAHKTPATVTGPVRMLLPMFAAEPIVVHVFGSVARGPRSATWNGTPVTVADAPRGLTLTVPDAVRAGVNELVLDVPVGSRLEHLEFDSTTQWWAKKR
jgi:hypothetical protein